MSKDNNIGLNSLFISLIIVKNYLIFFICLIFGVGAVAVIIGFFTDSSYDVDLIGISAIALIISLFTGFYLWKKDFFKKD